MPYYAFLFPDAFAMMIFFIISIFRSFAIASPFDLTLFDAYAVLFMLFF